MKLELIVPATQENLRKRMKAICPPLGLAMVAALTPPEVEVSLTDENVTAIDCTIRFARKMRLESAQFAWLVSYPGTALCESLDKAGRIVTKDWSQYESNPVFEPKLMSREMLKKGHDWTWREFYSLPSIWRRIGLARRNLVPFWVMNLSFRAAWWKKSRSGGFVSPRLSGV